MVASVALRVVVRKQRRRFSRLFLLFLAVVVTLCHISVVVAVPGRNIIVEDENRGDDDAACTLYLAPSTIPGAGLGLFAGISFARNQVISPGGDVVISIRDLDFHNGQKLDQFLLDDYTWTPHNFPRMDDEKDLLQDPEDLVAASPGIGAAANSIIALANVEQLGDTAFLTQTPSASHPAAGSSSPYQGREWFASQPIPSGAELFLNYGEIYFRKRTKTMGPLPFPRDHRIADFLLGVFQFLETSSDSSSSTSRSESDLGLDLWTSLQDMKRIWSQSRTMAALPIDYHQYRTILAAGGTAKQFYNQTIRDLDWLTQHGHCVDGLREGASAIPNAGRGAFASRSFRKGSVVTTAPLIQIPNKQVLTMYETKPPRLPMIKESRRDLNKPLHSQMLLNYCWGHPESDLVLSPYGVMTSLINCAPEDGKGANVKLQWSTASTHDEWRQIPLNEWSQESSTGLAWDFVALKDIAEGQEVLVDCGAEWYHAWNEQQNSFVSHHMSADEWNSIAEPDQQPSLLELNPVDYHIQCLRCLAVEQGILRPSRRLVGGKVNDFIDCEPLLSVTSPMTGMKYYVMRISIHQQERGKLPICAIRQLWHVPTYALRLTDSPAARSDLQPWSFRHEMIIPDDLFPELWKNRRVEGELSPLSHNCTATSRPFVAPDKPLDLPDATMTVS